MLGSPNSNTGTLLVLKPVSQNKEGEAIKPYFEISKKEGGTWLVEDDKSITEVRGNLVKADVVEEEYKGEKYFRIKLMLRDGDESYLVPFRLNIATRSLLNALSNLQSFDDVAISYYLSKAGFSTFSVNQSGERVSWKYELDEIPKADEVTLGKKKIKDYTKVDNFFIEVTRELSARLAKANNTPDKRGVAESEVEETTASGVGF